MTIGLGRQFQPELSVHNAVRAKRELLGITRRELCRRANLSPAYVSALEAGNLNPSLAAFARIAAELRMTPGEIFLIVHNASLQDDDDD